jgi:CDP-diacylglycerol---glycerol-3-phosphate 3-phosphatidyltransferase
MSASPARTEPVSGAAPSSAKPEAAHSERSDGSGPTAATPQLAVAAQKTSNKTSTGISWTSAFGRACGVLLDTIVRWLALSRINPNVLTFMGLVVNTWAAVLFGSANALNQQRMFFYAGLVIIFSGFFDLVDGQVARATNRVTRFGAFFDSVVDRYSDASQFFGLLIFFARGDRFFYLLLTAYVMISAIMVSYTRARAESLIGSCRVGFMERPERLVLVIIGALFNRMAPVLWVIAVLSTLTVIHRMRYTWTRTQDPPITVKG